MTIKFKFVIPTVSIITLCVLTVPGCKKDSETAKSSSAGSGKAVWVDPNTWTPDPNLPKPEISATIEIVKEPERKKVSFKITASEAHALTVQDIHFMIKYRTFDEAQKEWVYPEKQQVMKMMPFIENGKGVFQTAIVEKNLKPLAWDGANDNWMVEVLMYGPYWK